jgi:hypothetical protein
MTELQRAGKTSGRIRALSAFVCAVVVLASVALLDASAAATTSGVPSAPTAVRAMPLNGGARVRWTPPTLDGGSPITGYVVTPYLRQVAQPPRSFAATANAQQVMGLTNGGVYTFAVAAKNVHGTGPASSPSWPIDIGTPTRPNHVGALSAVDPYGRRIAVELSWTAPALTGGAPVTGYRVTVKCVLGLCKDVQLVPAPKPTVFNSPKTAESLPVIPTCFTTWTYSVSAINSRGTGLLSAPSNWIDGGTFCHIPIGGGF